MSFEFKQHQANYILITMAEELGQYPPEILDDPIPVADLIFSYLETKWIVLSCLPTLTDLIADLQLCLDAERICLDIYTLTLDVLLIQIRSLQTELISLFGIDTWINALAFLHSELNRVLI